MSRTWRSLIWPKSIAWHKRTNTCQDGESSESRMLRLSGLTSSVCFTYAPRRSGLPHALRSNSGGRRGGRTPDSRRERTGAHHRIGASSDTTPATSAVPPRGPRSPSVGRYRSGAMDLPGVSFHEPPLRTVATPDTNVENVEKSGENEEIMRVKPVSAL